MNQDSYQRGIDYLRISITDRCNERCLYCLPEGFQDWKPRADILSYEEILVVARAASELGFRRFRITGGEPLVRKDIGLFLSRVCSLPGIETVGLSTNGTRLAPLAFVIAQAGVRSINVSLDAINERLYQRITGGRLQDVLEGLKAVRSAGMQRVKLNCVLMRGINESQIWPLIEFAAEHELPLRFIELMPVSLTEMLSERNFFPIGEVQALIRKHTPMEPDSTRHGHGPAQYYRLPRFQATVGFIGAITNQHFCDGCNKMRLTADGKIRPCLGNHLEVDLMNTLRPRIDIEGLRAALLAAIRQKPKDHLFRDQYEPQRIMTAIGG